MKTITGFAAHAATVVLMAVCSGCASYNGPVSDHFDGRAFYNHEPDNGFHEHLRWLMEMQSVAWPNWIVDPVQPPPPQTLAGDDALRATYINQATVLIQAHQLNILTDPIWSDRTGPVSWIGPKRIRAPGVHFEDLPKIDVVLISHNHFDHLDLPTLQRIVKRDHPVVLVGLGVKALLTDFDSAQVHELDWWQDFAIPENRGVITFVPARHGSGRGLLDGNTTLWGAYAIQLPGGNVLFMGDTAFGECIQAIHQRFPSFRLAILPIGSYEKRWFMKSQHMNPDDAVRAHIKLSATHSMGMHFATFSEHAEQTVDAHEKDLAAALEKYRVPENAFWLPEFGEGRDF